MKLLEIQILLEFKNSNLSLSGILDVFITWSVSVVFNRKFEYAQSKYLDC